MNIKYEMVRFELTNIYIENLTKQTRYALSPHFLSAFFSSPPFLLPFSPRQRKEVPHCFNINAKEMERFQGFVLRRVKTTHNA
jgi:hypothetical protein